MHIAIIGQTVTYLNAKIGVLWIWGDFRLQNTFQERTVLKSIEIDKDKLQMKFSALNIDFNGPSLDFLGSRKPAHESIIEHLYPHKSRYFTIGILLLFASPRESRSPWACCPSQRALVTSFQVISTSMTMKDPELIKLGVLLIFAILGCSAHSKNKLRRNGWR